MKAVLLAGAAPGLRPLEYALPAPLIPFLGRPLVSAALRGLHEAGFTQAVLAVERRHSAIEQALEHGLAGDLPTALLPCGAPPTPESSLAALAARGARWTETIAVLPALAWTDADWPRLFAAHRAAGGGVSEIVVEGRPTGMLLVDPEAAFPGARRTLEARARWRPLERWDGYWTLAAEALATGDAHLLAAGEALPSGGPERSVVLGPLARLASSPTEIRGVVRLGAGALVDPGATLSGPVWIGADCRVGPGVRLEQCAVEGRARLHGPLELRRCLVYHNRAISFLDGSARILDGIDLDAEPAAEERSSVSMDLVRLAARTARASTTFDLPVSMR